MNSRNVIYPMTAGDLVQSAVIVGHHCLLVTVRDQASGDRGDLTFYADTPLLVTGISRT